MTGYIPRVLISNFIYETPSLPYFVHLSRCHPLTFQVFGKTESMEHIPRIGEIPFVGYWLDNCYLRLYSTTVPIWTIYQIEFSHGFLLTPRGFFVGVSSTDVSSSWELSFYSFSFLLC